MQVSNTIHYNSDAYLISKKQYDVEHKTKSQVDEPQQPQPDISSAKLEEKSYAKSINALESSQAVNSQNNSSKTVNNSSVEKALVAYAEVESTDSSRNPSSLDQVKEMVWLALISTLSLNESSINSAYLAYLKSY